MTHPTPFKRSRPSVWFLGPALLSIGLLGLAHREVLWPLLCGVAILSSYLTEISFAWPERGRRLRFGLTVVLGWAIAYLYFLLVFNSGEGLHYFPRFILRPWFYTPGAFLSVGLLAWLWHTPFRPKERGWAVYALSGWVVICSGQFYRPPSIIVALILLYCVAVLLALLFAPTGHQAHGSMWRPAGRQFFWLGSWILVIGMGSWGVIRGLHRLEEDMARLIGELLRLPTYSGSLGANGTMKLRRQQKMRLSTALVAAVESKRPPRYLRTRILSRYRKGMWSSQWRFTRWMPVETLPSGHTRFSMGTGLQGKASATSGAASALGRLKVRTFLSLSGAMLLPYGTTELTISARARCRQSLEMTLDCRPIHLLYRYYLKYDRGVRLRRGVFAASAGAMTLPIVPMPSLRRRLYLKQSTLLLPRRPKPSTKPAAVRVRVPQPLSKQGPLLSRSKGPSLGAKDAALPLRPGHLRRNTHTSLRPVLKALYPLALRVVGKHRAQPMLAAMAVQQYFRMNYEYSLDVALSQKGDPTVDFVLNKRPAYCQYFASGMALMMRALGHRARVANGFMVKEYNKYAKRWLVRKRDAHAWTEVFDPLSQRWVAFDATAPAMLSIAGRGDPKSAMAQFSAWMQVRWKELIAASRNVRLGDWLRDRSLDWLETFSRPLNWSYLIGLILFIWGLRNRSAVWWWCRRSWGSLWGLKAEATGPIPSPRTLQQEKAREILLATLEAWGVFGIVLQPHETPEAYLHRLAGLSQHNPEAPTPPIDALQRCVERYNALRFLPSGARVDAGHAAEVLAFEQFAKECLP